MSGITEPRRWRIESVLQRPPGEITFFDDEVVHGPVLKDRERVDVIEASAYDALAAENAALREALGEAIDLAEEGWGYDATGYFRKKHGVDGDLATLRATLANPEREQALTQLARDAQDAGAYDDRPQEGGKA